MQKWSINVEAEYQHRSGALTWKERTEWRKRKIIPLQQFWDRMP